MSVYTSKANSFALFLSAIFFVEMIYAQSAIPTGGNGLGTTAASLAEENARQLDAVHDSLDDKLKYTDTADNSTGSIVAKTFQHNPNLPRTAVQCSDSEEANYRREYSFSIMDIFLRDVEPNFSIQGCVRASNDTQAKQMCGNYNIFNPGNPQYNRGSDRYGTISTSAENYYYCIPGNVSMISVKVRACEEAARRHGQYVEYRWSRNGTGEDGTCECRQRDSNNQFREYCDPYLAESFADARIAVDIGPIDLQIPEIRLEAEGEVQDKINQCISRWRERQNTCSQEMQNVRNTCTDQSESPASQALSGISEGAAAAGAGRGVQQSCFRVGVAAMGARELVERTRDNCTASGQMCRTNCNPAQTDNMLEECLREARVADINTLTQSYPDLATQLNSARDEIRTSMEENLNTCSTVAPQRAGTMDRLMTELGQTLQTSTRCACQTSSTPGSNCDRIPEISACEANPAAPGCNAYQPVAACIPGGDVTLCNCVQNPGGAGCQQINNGQGPPTFANTTGPSQFGSNLAAAGGGSGSSFGGGGRAQAGSFNDFSGSLQGSASGNQPLREGEASGSGGAGGVGAAPGAVAAGGPSGNGEGASPSAASGDKTAAAKKSSFGVFRDIKNAIGGFFGGDKAGKAAAAKKSEKAAAGTPDMRKFKPKIRGSGPARDIASANDKTLFELVNECVNGLRCRTTVNSFIKEP